jgi:serine/threonine-protein kinase
MSDVTDLRAALSLALGAGYLIDRELDGAGFARVFVAHEEAHSRDVAIKVLSPELSRLLSPQRFETEMRLGQWLQEAHTLPVFGTGHTATGQLYYTMPFVRGETLRQRIEQGPVGFDESVGVLRDVARSMAYAHGMGCLHRNIKPENILVANARGVVVDFCLSAAVLASRLLPAEDMQTAEGTVHGTPGYMSPEQMRGDPATDFRADIYAWGVMAYELLLDIDQVEHLAELEQITAADLSEVPPLMLYKRHGVPEQLAQLVMRCLDEDPSARPANAGELVTVLERIPDGRLALALENNNAARWVGASILLGLALFCATGYVVWKLQRREIKQRSVIAVLPFETSSAQSDSLFADQLGEAVSADLAKIATIRVIDRGSILSIDGTGRTTQAIGKMLGATHVLRGTIRFVRDASGPPRMEVIPSLYHVGDGTLKWTGKPELVSPGHPFAVEAAIAKHVANELSVFVSSRNEAEIAQFPTTDSAALAFYSAGSRRFVRSTDSSLAANAEALHDFERAYQRDTSYSDAYGAASAILIRAGLQSGQRTLIDSAAQLARLSREHGHGHVPGLVTAAHVALYRDHPDEAYAIAQQVVSNTPSNAEALKVRTMLLPFVGDSVGAWRDVEELVRIAPRSIDALLIAATAAEALRRFSDANEFILRARVLAPQRIDLIRRSALLNRASGEFGNMTRALMSYRARGGRLVAADLAMLRVGAPSLRQELANGTAADFDVKTRADSFTYYSEKARLFMLQGESARSRPLLDSSAVMLREILADLTLRPADRRRYVDLQAWTDAARGERVKALAVATGLERDPMTQQWPDGQFAAATACNTAEIYALVDDVPAMLPELRRCLTLPGGLWQSSILTEPALARQASDPRARELFRELKLDISH